jgi:hypothetical protein
MIVSLLLCRWQTVGCHTYTAQTQSWDFHTHAWMYACMHEHKADTWGLQGLRLCFKRWSKVTGTVTVYMCVYMHVVKRQTTHYLEIKTGLWLLGWCIQCVTTGLRSRVSITCSRVRLLSLMPQSAGLLHMLQTATVLYTHVQILRIDYNHGMESRNSHL